MLQQNFTHKAAKRFAAPLDKGKAVENGHVFRCILIWGDYRLQSGHKSLEPNLLNCFRHCAQAYCDLSDQPGRRYSLSKDRSRADL